MLLSVFIRSPPAPLLLLLFVLQHHQQQSLVYATDYFDSESRLEFGPDLSLPVEESIVLHVTKREQLLKNILQVVPIAYIILGIY